MREFDELGGDLDEARLAAQVVARHAVHFGRRDVDVALRIEAVMAVAPGESPVDDLDGGDLDDPMTLLRIEAGGFGVEEELAHVRRGWPLLSVFLDRRLNLGDRALDFVVGQIALRARAIGQRDGVLDLRLELPELEIIGRRRRRRRAFPVPSAR